MRYDREALLYKGDAWHLWNESKITLKDYIDFRNFITHNSDMDALIAEYSKLLALANSREKGEGK